VKQVTQHGDALRSLLQEKETKKYFVEVYFNIPVRPQPAFLFTAITDRNSGRFLRGPPLLTGSPGAPFDYKGAIRVREIENELADFVSKRRPPMSKLVQSR
jgi:hypothetical protein